MKLYAQNKTLLLSIFEITFDSADGLSVFEIMKIQFCQFDDQG